MIKRIAIILFVFIGLEVMAWGPIGHRVVGKIAQNHLKRKALKNVERVLGNESLASVSNWMDDIKSDENYNHTHDWHWVTIPTDQTYAETKKNEKGDIVMTISRLVKELRVGGLEINKEREHLKMLVHLIGDIHQPLHVGTGEDAGGNRRSVTWFGKNTNLHRVFDSDVIDSFQLSYSELVENLDHPTREMVDSWQKSTVEDWAYEAITLRDQVYDLPEDGKLGYEFRYKNKAMIELQMLKAGVRLAGVLNDIYTGK